MRIRTSSMGRGTVWGLLVLLAAPAFGGERRQRALRWEAFVQLKPGTAVELALDDGQRLAGRLLAADALEASLVDFTGRGLSDGEQKRVVRELIKARRHLRAAMATDAQATSGADADAPMVRRVAHDQVTAVYVPRSGSPLGGVFRVVAIVAGVYLLALLALLFACSGNSQCLS